MLAPPGLSEPGPPDDESRRELERLEAALASGKAALILKRCVLWYAVLGFLLYRTQPAFHAGTMLLLAVWAFVPLVLAQKHWIRMVSTAARIRDGESIRLPPAFRDGRILLFLAAGLLAVCIAVHNFAALSPALTITLLFTLVVAFVVNGWAFAKFRGIMARAEPGFIHEPRCREALWISLLIFLVQVFLFVRLQTH